MARFAEFAVYKNANAIGDVLGHAREESLKLHCEEKKSPRTYIPCYENAANAWDHAEDEQLQEIANSKDMTTSELKAAIESLPSIIPSEVKN